MLFWHHPKYFEVLWSRWKWSAKSNLPFLITVVLQTRFELFLWLLHGNSICIPCKMLIYNLPLLTHTQPYPSNSPDSLVPTARSLPCATAGLPWAVSCQQGHGSVLREQLWFSWVIFIQVIQDAAGEEISSPCPLCRHGLCLFLKQRTSSSVEVRRKCIFGQSRSLPELFPGLGGSCLDRPCLMCCSREAQGLWEPGALSKPPCLEGQPWSPSAPAGTPCPALTALVTQMNLSKLIRTMLKTEAVHTR